MLLREENVGIGEWVLASSWMPQFGELVSSFCEESVVG